MMYYTFLDSIVHIIYAAAGLLRVIRPMEEWSAKKKSGGLKFIFKRANHPETCAMGIGLMKKINISNRKN